MDFFYVNNQQEKNSQEFEQRKVIKPSRVKCW